MLFSRQIFEKYSNTKFHENQSSGSRVIPCGRIDGHIWWNSKPLFEISRKHLKGAKAGNLQTKNALSYIGEHWAAELYHSPFLSNKNGLKSLHFSLCPLLSQVVQQRHSACCLHRFVPHLLEIHCYGNHYIKWTENFLKSLKSLFESTYRLCLHMTSAH